MGEARLAVHFAGPLVTVQDGGRVGHMRFGVPASGAMDRVAFAAAHAALGNPAGSTALEISLGGLVLECKAGEITVAVAGGDFSIEHAGKKSSGWSVLTLKPGERLSIRGGASGSWAYLALAGELQAKHWLGHTATHSTSGFGGGAVQSGQQLVVAQAAVRAEREGQIEQPSFLAKAGCARVVMGPQDQWFSEEAIAAIGTSPYRLTDAFDRMGVRLDGPALALGAALSIPSEPIVRGSVQVAGDGVPTVLLADHQTTGGYPKIATVIAPDTDVIAQMRSNQNLQFEVISAETAVEISRQFAQALATYLEKIAVPKGTLQQRLMGENLISGVVYSE